MEVAFGSAFKRSFKKYIKGNTDLAERFWQKLEVFTTDPFDPSLKTHKLSGKMKDLWSFSLDYDARVVLYFEENSKAIFIDIGSHDDVY